LIPEHKINEKQRREAQWAQEAKRIQLTFLVALIYFVIVAVMIYMTLRFNIPLAVEVHGARQGSPWLALILIVYYVLPLAMGFLIGVVFKPFWPNFRNTVILIFAIHGIYSVIMYGWRQNYLDKWRDVIRVCEMGLEKKEFVVDQEGRRIVSLCRWAAFYRPTSWEGKDDWIYDRR